MSVGRAPCHQQSSPLLPGPAMNCLLPGTALLVSERRQWYYGSIIPQSLVHVSKATAVNAGKEGHREESRFFPLSAGASRRAASHGCPLSAPFPALCLSTTLKALLAQPTLGCSPTVSRVSYSSPLKHTVCLLLLLCCSFPLRRTLSPLDFWDPAQKTQAPVPHPATVTNQVSVLFEQMLLN